MPENEIKNIIEAALFAYGKPLGLEAIFLLFQEEDGVTKDSIGKAIEAIEADCQARGVELKKVASGYRFQAKQDYAKWLQPLWEEKPPRYSRAMLETMVLIAYKQPITRGEIEDVRGVSVSSHIVKTLQERDWIRVVGHRDVPGKPALFATTKGFLDYFNLSSLDQLPSLAQIRDLDKINEELEFPDGVPTHSIIDDSHDSELLETAADDSVNDERESTETETETETETVDQESDTTEGSALRVGDYLTDDDSDAEPLSELVSELSSSDKIDDAISIDESIQNVAATELESDSDTQDSVPLDSSPNDEITQVDPIELAVIEDFFDQTDTFEGPDETIVAHAEPDVDPNQQETHMDDRMEEEASSANQTSHDSANVTNDEAAVDFSEAERDSTESANSVD